MQTRTLFLSLILVPLAWTATYSGTQQDEDEISWTGAFGEYGAELGSFVLPLGVATDRRGFVYVVDAVTGRLVKYRRNGEFEAEWLLQVPAPLDVALAHVDQVYVTDDSCDCVYVGSFDHTLKRGWGSYGTGYGQFRTPAGVTVDGHKVYVADSGNHRIQVFTLEGEFLASWGSHGAGEGQFSSPTGISVDRIGNVYVADSKNHRIQKFDPKGAFLVTWGSKGIGEVEFRVPTDVAVTDSDVIYVVDSENQRIQVLDRNGAYVREWGTFGLELGEFHNPWHIAITEDQEVYITDSGNHRVQKVLAEGTTTWGSIKKKFGQ